MGERNRQLPNERGYFGEFGGKFVPETLMPALGELEQAYRDARADPAFKQQFEQLCRQYIGRPTPLYPAEQLSAEMEELKTRLSDLKHKRQTLSTGIDSQATEFYDKLKGQKGTAVAKVEQGICHGCRISLSAAQLQQVRATSLVQCSNCGRILFLA